MKITLKDGSVKEYAEAKSVIEILKDYVDIYLPDLKYFDPVLSARYSGAGDYFSVASRAIAAMSF